MAKYHYIFYYYIKDLDPDCQRHIMGEMRELKNSYDDEKVLNTKKYMDNWKLTQEEMNYFLENIYWKYERINRYLLKHQRRPFFDTNDLKDCIRLRNEYLEFISEDECIRKYGVTKFDEYVPEEFSNDLTTVIELYTDNLYIIEALQTTQIPKVNFISGLSHYNCYQFINWMLQYEGMEPLFEDVNDEEKCEIKRKELLQLLPYEKCLKYWKINSEDEIDKYKRGKMIFQIEKFIDVYGSDMFNTSWRYHIGFRLYDIINPDIDIEKRKEYINYVNNTNDTPLFVNPNNLDECIKFVKDNLILKEIK